MSEQIYLPFDNTDYVEVTNLKNPIEVDTLIQYHTDQVSGNRAESSYLVEACIDTFKDEGLFGTVEVLLATCDWTKADPKHSTETRMHTVYVLVDQVLHEHYVLVYYHKGKRYVLANDVYAVHCKYSR